MKMSVMNWISFVLVVVGAFNWGLIGLFNFNIISTIFGVGTISRIIYSVIGLSAVYAIASGFIEAKKKK